MTTATQASDYRLPRHSAPNRYDIELAPDLDAATFNGTVSIDLTTEHHTDSLTLNAIELEIGRCRLDGVDVPYQLDGATEQLVVRPADGVEVGNHRLDIEFTGVLNDQLRGWYRSTYVDDTGTQRTIATSQMQSTDCRRAFPCWDEPEFKAVFGVTLVVDDDLLAVSNGAEVDRSPAGPGKVRVAFADTMPMSTYLVAFVVGPLDVTEAVMVGDVPLRIVHVPGKAHLTGFGLEVASFALDWFERYYGIAYPSDKVDLIALPDFAAGAMENLGCITFRENLLLVDPDTATQPERQLVADVVSHELAHMWFGDLVTMRWWNGIWLNEAFATFMEIAAADAFRPAWQRWTTFGLERSDAFEVDSLDATRTVEFEVHSPADAEGMFDVLTYLKGGALLRMLEQHLGPDRFRAGVNAYLERFSYRSTETGDLWDAIEGATGEPVRRIMDSWIWQPGYPLVSAELDGDELVLTQRRFRFDGDSDESIWAIPVAIRHGAVETKLLLDQRRQSVAVGGAEAPSPAPVVVNAGGHGFYRVAYGRELLDRFTPEALATMSTLERYHIVDDSWNALVAGTMESGTFLDLVGRFADEPALAVWRRLSSSLGALGRLVGDDANASAAFERRVGALASPALDRLGTPGDDDNELAHVLRGLLLRLVAIEGGDDAAVDLAREFYAHWERDHGAVNAELAAAATGIVAATGDEADYERLLGHYRSASTPQVQLRHLYALSEFRDPSLMERTCELAMSDEVKTQNAPFLLNRCIANRWLGDQAWRFVRDHWSAANEAFPRSTIVRMVGSIVTLDRPETVDEIQAFFAEHPIEQATATLEQLLERQRVNAAFREREAERLRAELR